MDVPADAAGVVKEVKINVGDKVSGRRCDAGQLEAAPPKPLHQRPRGAGPQQAARLIGSSGCQPRRRSDGTWKCLTSAATAMWT